MEIIKSRIPPATRKDPVEIPRNPRRYLPKRIKNTETAIEITMDRIIILFLLWSRYPARKTRKTGISPSGSTTKKRVKKTVGM